jgi:hypothetical protein
MLKHVVATKDDQGNSVSLAVLKPTASISQKAEMYRAKAFSEAIKEGCMLKAELDKHLRKANLWDEDRQRDFERLRKEILDGELLLKTKRNRSGERATPSQAKKIALEVGRSRSELANLLSQRSTVEASTAENIAEQAKFNFLVAACTVDNISGKPFFRSVDEYIERGTEQVSLDVASKMADILFGNETDSLKKLPENEFLQKYGFVDDKLRLINKEGHLVDSEGRLIDDEGYYIDESGQRVDIDGNPIAADGNYAEDPDAYFVDEQGNRLTDDGKPLPAPTPASAAVAADVNVEDTI